MNESINITIRESTKDALDSLMEENPLFDNSYDAMIRFLCLKQMFREMDKEIVETQKKPEPIEVNINLELTKIERRLESNNSDDWDIGLGMVRDLRKKVEAKKTK